MKNNTWYTLAALITGVALVFAACGGGEKTEKVSLSETAKAAEPADQPVPVADPAADPQPAGAKVIAAETAANFRAVGSFVAKEETTISTKLGGTLVAVPLDEGDRVNPDTLVARIDREDFELGLRNAEAQLAVAVATVNNARSEYERKKKLFDDGAITASLFEQFKTNLELAEAQSRSAMVAIDLAKKQLRDTEVHAGVRGVIVKRLVSAGEFVDKGQALIVVQKVDPIKLVFSVPQRLAADIRRGTTVNATISSYPGAIFTGTVTLVSPTIDTNSRTVPIEAEYDNADGRIKPGFFAECTVGLVKSNPLFIVPNNALYSTETGLEVKVERGGAVVTVPVNLVQRNGGSSTIAGDLREGETLVLQY